MKVIGEKIPERLEDTFTGDRQGHEFRYRLARGFTDSWDRVLDAACGTGYGGALMHPCRYTGVDKDAPTVGPYVRADLNEWVPDFLFDVAVSFETLEHLENYRHLIGVMQQAVKWIVASVPVVPTVGNNPYHFHDFAPGQLAAELTSPQWRVYQTVLQPDEEAEIVVMARVREFA